eukprot:scaffold76006_cov16-Tisochrysis_lutea.AAC.1
MCVSCLAVNYAKVLSGASFSSAGKYAVLVLHLKMILVPHAQLLFCLAKISRFSGCRFRKRSPASLKKLGCFNGCRLADSVNADVEDALCFIETWLFQSLQIGRFNDWPGGVHWRRHQGHDEPRSLCAQ